MKNRNSPSGPVSARIKQFSHDWGTIPSGDTSFIVDLSSLVPAGWAYFITTIGPFQEDTLGYAFRANDEGRPSGMLFASNFTAGPFALGSMLYKITMFDPQRLR